MSKSEQVAEIIERIAELEARLADLEARLPAHSIPVNLIAEMDQLDEQIQAEKSRLKAMQDEGPEA